LGRLGTRLRLGGTHNLSKEGESAVRSDEALLSAGRTLVADLHNSSGWVNGWISFAGSPPLDTAANPSPTSCLQNRALSPVLFSMRPLTRQTLPWNASERNTGRETFTANDQANSCLVSALCRSQRARVRPLRVRRVTPRHPRRHPKLVPPTLARPRPTRSRCSTSPHRVRAAVLPRLEAVWRNDMADSRCTPWCTCVLHYVARRSGDGRG